MVVIINNLLLKIVLLFLIIINNIKDLKIRLKIKRLRSLKLNIINIIKISSFKSNTIVLETVINRAIKNSDSSINNRARSYLLVFFIFILKISY